MWNKHIVLHITDRFKCSGEITTDRRNELLRLMSSSKRLSFNLYFAEIKKIPSFITMISPCHNSSYSEKLQLICHNKKMVICRMDDCNWNGELTQCLWKQESLQVIFWKKNSTLENTGSLQVASWRNDRTFPVYGCKCSFEITICLN